MKMKAWGAVVAVATTIAFYTSEQPASVLVGVLKCGQCQKVPLTSYFMCEIKRGTVKEKGDVYVFRCPGGTAYIHKSQAIKIIFK